MAGQRHAALICFLLSGLWRRALLQPQSGSDLFDALSAALLQQDAMPELSVGDDARELRGLLPDSRESRDDRNGTSAPLPIASTRPKGELRGQAEACERDGRAADAESVRQLLAVHRSPQPRLILGLDQFEEMFT